MAAYGGGHVNLIMPVYRNLVQDYDITFLGLSIATGVLKAEGIPHKRYSDYEHLILDDEARRYGRELADRWHVAGKVPRAESEAYLGASMRDLVREHGKEKACRLLDTDGRKAFLPVHTVRQIIEFEQPDVIVTTNSPRTERALTLAGRTMGIPTINIHDHLGFEKRHKLEADVVAVMCAITRDNLILAGHDPARLVITGQPAFDPIVRELKEFNREILCRRHGLDPAAHYVLLGTQKQFNEQMLVDIIEQARGLPHHCFLIKPHPGEDHAMYLAIKKRFPRVILFTDVPIRELIFLSEVTIALWSTVALESVLMGRPTIQLNYPELPNIIPLFPFQVALEARSAKEVGKQLTRALESAALRAELYAQGRTVFAELLSGSSTEAFCRLIRKVLENGFQVDSA